MLQIKKILFIIFLIIIICFSFISISFAESTYIWSGSSKELLQTSSNSTDLKLESGGAILVEQTTGTVLYEHNSHEKFRPASVTKVMSLLLIMEAIDNRRNFLKR